MKKPGEVSAAPRPGSAERYCPNRYCFPSTKGRMGINARKRDSAIRLVFDLRVPHARARHNKSGHCRHPWFAKFRILRGRQAAIDLDLVRWDTLRGDIALEAIILQFLNQEPPNISTTNTFISSYWQRSMWYVSGHYYPRRWRLALFNSRYPHEPSSRRPASDTNSLVGDGSINAFPSVRMERDYLLLRVTRSPGRSDLWTCFFGRLTRKRGFWLISSPTGERTPTPYPWNPSRTLIHAFNGHLRRML